MHVQFENVDSKILYAIWKCKQLGQLHELDVIIYSYLLFRSLITVGKK